MEVKYGDLAQHLAQTIKTPITPPKQLLIGIAGAPGSGKSTTCKQLCHILNTIHSISTVILPMDGFHYYKRELDQMENPHLAYARRGSPFTFNSEKFYQTICELKENHQVMVPSFDHSVGDPIENDISITPSHRIVLIEGNYILFDRISKEQDPINEWRKDCKPLLDELWFIDCDVDMAMERVVKRHKKAMQLTTEEATLRANQNDRPNALSIETLSKKYAQRLIASENDGTFENT